MGNLRRLFVEKRSGYDVYAQNLFVDLKENLGISSLHGVRVLNRYDFEGIADEEYVSVRDSSIFSEPPVDIVYEEELETAPDERMFAVEYLPGQYDQRADSAAQCIQIVTHGMRPRIATAQVIVLQGQVSDTDFTTIKQYCINPVDSREASLTKPATLEMEIDVPPDVEILDSFIAMDASALDGLRQELGLAMRLEDLQFCQVYFRDTEKRDPSITEIRMIDTYWSDHCRHTTFLTSIENVSVDDGHFTVPVNAAFERYMSSRKDIYGDHREKDVCLMDIATLGMKELRKRGLLKDLDESEEINACSIVVPVEMNGKREDWLVMFKNETHNHPTEIEPFGGAATCLGGAIRDPLSGRSYVYHAMRVTGSGDPRKKVEETLPGKLPQRKITVLAAQGYSSYGNQIGLATGMVSEIYDEGFVAKRMEIGAVIGAAPKGNVIRSVPEPGDIVVLVGGRTGRDGCGGATGSSKEHTEESIQTCSAEVQKGNPPTERKIQRLFHKAEVSRMIKRCNDFGAGGVSVAIGELAPGLDIDLDAVPKKYEGLDGTELAISESQERMAVVIAPSDIDRFRTFAEEENLEIAIGAHVTGDRRLRMHWRGKMIVDISRDFIDTNGVRQTTDVQVNAPQKEADFFEQCIPDAQEDLRNAWLERLADLNICSQRGLVERFDSTIGAGTVLLPFGGKYQATPTECMVAKIPVEYGETKTGTIMSHGYNPKLSTWSPFHGAVYAIVEAVAKIVAVGGNHHSIRLTLQEYFEKVGTDPQRWGKPFAALLGAFFAQVKIGIPAIGGKDSMSGTFKDLTVPPTLVAFGLTSADVRHTISPEFKDAGNTVVYIPLPRDSYEMPEFSALDTIYTAVHEGIKCGAVVSAHTIRSGGVVEAVSKMSFGNRIGVRCNEPVDNNVLFGANYGSFVLEITSGLDCATLFKNIDYYLLGETQKEPFIEVNGNRLSVDELYCRWKEPLENVFPDNLPQKIDCKVYEPYTKRPTMYRGHIAKPRVCITVFPGTNCEYDTARAFEKAGAEPDIFVMRNCTPSDIDESIHIMAKKIAQAQIVMIPGGFSAGDEPDGSGKFIAAFFRNPRIKDAVEELLEKRDGLMLGICNGFQALIKLGLVPWGSIQDIDADSPTLTFNTIGRHISRMVYTKVCSVKSPWLARVSVGDIHTIPISHGEGRFVAQSPLIDKLFENGQIATRYVDCDGRYGGGMDGNPNGSYGAIEGITSPDGRVFGKMGHSERKGDYVARNIYGVKDQLLFESGMDYFR